MEWAAVDRDNVSRYGGIFFIFYPLDILILRLKRSG